MGGTAAASCFFWIEQGVRIFRVDNPHTKPFAFWQWIIAEITRDVSGGDFPRRGVHPAQGDVSTRQAGVHAIVYLLRLAQHQAGVDAVSHGVDDERRARILSSQFLAEHAGHFDRISPTWWATSVHDSAGLAATLSANYGIYGPAFELCENRPREVGSEEYLDSEKYEIRQWDLSNPASLQEFITRVNRIRHENPASAE